MSAAVRIERIGLNVADLDAALSFYQGVLGFRIVRREHRGGPGFAGLTGIAGARAEVAILQLGRQTIELTAFDPPGRSYPAERAAADPWFQHFAIVAADMDAAYAALQHDGRFQPISTGGPQLLPPETGSIVAYKFRDPEGHPLELSFFPRAVAAPEWRSPPAGAVFLGIDHSAIAVRDVAASLKFYVDGLGLTVAARQTNAGPTQDRLDGLTTSVVDIVVLTLPGGGPHLELLAYRTPPVRPAPPPAVDDIAATRLAMRVGNLDALADGTAAFGGERVSKGVVVLADGARAALVRDPDGHLIELRA